MIVSPHSHFFCLSLSTSKTPQRQSTQFSQDIPVHERSVYVFQYKVEGEGEGERRERRQRFSHWASSDLRKPSGRNVVFFLFSPPPLHPLVYTINILSFKRNYMFSTNLICGYSVNLLKYRRVVHDIVLPFNAIRSYTGHLRTFTIALKMVVSLCCRKIHMGENPLACARQMCSWLNQMGSKMDDNSICTYATQTSEGVKTIRLNGDNPCSK